MKFLAIDVETANSDYSSICQIGIVGFDDDKAVVVFESFINPNTVFSKTNISIHGITENDVAGMPTWQELYPRIYELLANRIVVHHTHFDYTSINRACEKYNLPPMTCTWLDTAKVVRRTWPEVSKSGYGLKPMAKKLGISFNHHNATEDARAAGEILIEAIKVSTYTLDIWLQRINDFKKSG
ncbi:3'-5' exonuclease [Bdellovibrio bacteriovorus]|uniref:3'-5' exonuclease n=1 Tax=Bdellovibrio bacteriovorus TaxID=959 RepID=UPI0035A61AE1